MGLPSNYVGTAVTWPIRVTPGSKPNYQRADNRDPVNCVVSQIVKATFTDVPTVSSNGIGSDAGPNATTVAFTIDGALSSGGTVTFAVPCSIIATVTHGSSVVGQTVSLTGTDMYGRAITETLTIPAGGTSQVVTSGQTFKTLTAASQTSGSNASTNTCNLGNSKRLGLPFKCSCVTIIGETQDGANPTAGTIVAASTSANNDPRGAYTPNAAPNGSIDWVLWFISDDLGDLW